MTDDNGRGGKPESGKGRGFAPRTYSAQRRTGAPAGERKFGKPAPRTGAPTGAPTGERRFAKPAPRTGAPAGERKYGKPALRTGAPTGTPTGERRFAKPAPRTGAPAGERKYGNPAPRTGAPTGAPTGERRFAKPAPRTGAPAGERSYGKPAPRTGAPAGERKYSKPAPRTGAPTGAPTGERRYGKPALHTGAPTGAPAGERRFAKPAPRTGAPTGERRFARPASRTGAPSFRSAPRTGGAGDRRFARPVTAHRAPASPAVPVEETGLRLGARRLAYDVLCDVHQNGAFAALSLNDHLRGKTLSPEDRRLVTNIVYGTLENELQIDFALDKLMEHPTNEPSQRDILRMSAYQILFLDRVPDSAAVNEGVKLCKVVGMESASGFINAVLRNLVRGKEDIGWPKKEEDLRAYLSIMASVPMWLVDRVIADYGAEEAEKILMHRETAHNVVVRPNFTMLTDEKLEKLLTQKELRFEHGLAPHAYLVYGTSELNFDPDYQKGMFSIQGQSSMLSAEAVQVKPGMKILDACAAPGGKSAYLCEQMQLTGRVYAWELHEKRAMLLEATKRRLHLENLRISVRDATELRPDLESTLDAVLLDAPCSGTGVIAQKPDIKLRLASDDVDELVKTQFRLLEALCRYVKPNGTLVYSTCSILPDENAKQIERFLGNHPEFTMESLPLSYPETIRAQQTPSGLQLLGYRDGTEGFYIARMRRTR